MLPLKLSLQTAGVETGAGSVDKASSMGLVEHLDGDTTGRWMLAHGTHAVD
jgi:hypothetical protein